MAPRKLAWSKTGSVAHIAQDGRTITVQALVRDNKSGRWSLSNGTSKPIIAQDNARFTHLDWSSSGNDLVVTDQNGRLYVYVMAFALNRLMPNPLQYTVPQDDLSAVVGLHWLPMNMGPSPRVNNTSLSSSSHSLATDARNSVSHYISSIQRWRSLA